MFLAFILATALQIGFNMPARLAATGCQADGPVAVSNMTAHARVYDAGMHFISQDSLTGQFPGDRVAFEWNLPPGYYWVEAWASNRIGSGCPVRFVFQVQNLPPVSDTSRVFAGSEVYEVYDITGRRVAKGRGDWDRQGVRPGIYWVSRGAGQQRNVKKVILR
jgi:hypothetical protein